MAERAADSPRPDGLEDQHAEADRGFRRHASPISILVLGTLMAAALSGVLGGGRSPTRRAEGAAASIAVTTPHIVRNGIFFETRIAITAKADLAKPTLAIPATLWRDLTINSDYPDAEAHGYKDGAFTFTYAPLKAGDALELKFDGQVNPPLTLGTAGTIVLRDGDTPIATLPIAMRVLP